MNTVIKEKHSNKDTDGHILSYDSHRGEMFLVILQSLVSDHSDDFWLVYNLSDLLTADVFGFFFCPIRLCSIFTSQLLF